MKTITIILFSVLINACGASKNTASNLDSSKEESAKTSEVNQDTAMVIEYSATTRGSYFTVNANSKNITYKKAHNEEPTSKPCSKADWSKVMQYAKNVDLKALNTIEPPSKAHQYDGARIAVLKITKDGETYQTQSFDDGNPPKEIADLVNTVIELTNTQKD